MDDSLVQISNLSKSSPLWPPVMGQNVNDIALLELMLPHACAASDTPAARASRLLAAFGNLGRVLHADDNALLGISGMNAEAVQQLRSLRAFIHRALQSKIERNVIASWEPLIDYCTLTMAHNRVEEFRVLYLDHSHALLADEVMQRGTINHVPVYPREILRRALELGAAGLILVHNHPSGNPTPSQADISITERIVKATAVLDIAVHEHLIITDSGWNSFCKMGLVGSSAAASASVTH